MQEHALLLRWYNAALRTSHATLAKLCASYEDMLALVRLCYTEKRFRNAAELRGWLNRSFSAPDALALAQKPRDPALELLGRVFLDTQGYKAGLLRKVGIPFLELQGRTFGVEVTDETGQLRKGALEKLLPKIANFFDQSVETPAEALELFRKQGWTVLESEDLRRHVPNKGNRADRIFASLLWDLVSHLRRTVVWEEVGATI